MRDVEANVLEEVWVYLLLIATLFFGVYMGVVWKVSNFEVRYTCMSEQIVSHEVVCTEYKLNEEVK